MNLEMEMPKNLEENLKRIILEGATEVINEYKKKFVATPWLSLKDGAAYAGVSYNSFIKFREMGLRVCEIDGIKRVSKNEIDLFLMNHSY